MISPGEVCRVTNHGEVITIGWDNIQYILQTDEEAIVPAEAVINAFGDPRSKEDIYTTKTIAGTTAWVPDRPSEVRRLRAKYANHDGPEQVIVGPDVTVLTIHGEPVTTVLDDPLGETVNPAMITVTNERNLMALIESQAQQLEQLRAMVGTDGAIITSEGELPVDESDDRQIAPHRASSKPDLAANE